MSLRRRLLNALHPAQPVSGGNSLSLRCNGDAYFPALLTAINEATSTIRLETYLYADDAIGHAVTSALCAAATRGVDVRLVVDGFGARNIDLHHLPRLTQAGVQVRVYRPEHHLWRHLLSRKRSRLRRMHRKMALFDGGTAFIGGINILDDATDNPSPTRLDFAVQIFGPMVQPIAEAIDRQWQTLSRRPLFHRSIKLAPTQTQPAPVGTIRAGLLLRNNLSQRRSIENAYVQAIQSARDHITLAMAYFIPSRNILNALLSASERGVKVRLLLQGKIEYRLQHYASQSLYRSLLNAGIRLYEYQPGFMHAKVGVIDGRWATLGSANLDPFSLLVAQEANIVIEDDAFCAQLEAKLQQEIETHSQEITAAAWGKKSSLHRALRVMSARVLFRLLSLTRYADNY